MPAKLANLESVMDIMWIRDFKWGMRNGIPIALGYVSVSFTFGLMAVSVGMSWWQAVLVSMTNLTSAGQFAGLDIMVAGVVTAYNQFAVCFDVAVSFPKGR